MNSLKMSIFALSMSLSMGVMSASAVAATTMDSTTGSEDNLNRPNSSGTPNIQDCSIRNGNDKLLCEQQMQNDPTRSMPNDNSRINRNRNNDGNMIDDRISRDRSDIEITPNNTQSIDPNSGNSNLPPTGSDTNTGTSTGTSSPM